MQPAPSSYRPSVDPGTVLENLQSSDSDFFLVTTSDGELVGMLDRESIEQSAR